MRVKISSYLKSLQKPLSRLSVRRQGALIVAIPVTCFVTSLLAIAWLRNSNLDAREQAEENKQVILEVNRAIATLGDAQTSLGSYALSRRQEFLNSHSDALSRLPKSLEKINSWLEDAPERQLFREIKRNIQFQINYLQETRQIIDNLDAENSLSPQLSDQLIQNKLKMDSLRQQVERFTSLEERRLQLLDRAVTQRRLLISGFLWFALFVGLLGGWVSWQLFKNLERKLSGREESLRESRMRVQAIVDNAADGIITLDENGNIESFNPAAERIFGYQSTGIVKANLRQLIAEPFRSDTTSDSFNYFVGTAGAKLRACQRETVGRKADGTIFPMDLVVSEMPLAKERLYIAICRDITERRQADEMLHNQAQLLDLANDSIIVLDLEGRITYWNQGAKLLYGWKKKEAIAQSIHTLLKTEFPQPIEEIERELQRQGYWEGELVQVKQDGTKVTVASSWTLQRDALGQPVAILEINNDITQRQLAEKALRESEQMLQLVMDNIPQYIFWKDRNGVYLGCNQNVAKLMGLESSANIVGLTDGDLPLSPEQAERYRAQELQVMETNIPVSHRIEALWLNRPDSKPIWVDASKIPLTDSAGVVVGILATFEDITARKLSESARKESEERFRVTFEQAAVGMAQVALSGEWLMANRKLCEILGYSRAELLAGKFQDITYPEDLPPELEFLPKLQAGEIEMYSMEKRFVRKNGTLVWVNITVSPLRSPEGNLSLMKVVEDISDRKTAEEAMRTRAEELARTTAILAKTTAVLKKRNQELDQFAYVVSHDLKAPLRAIANLSTWIEEDLDGALTPETRHQMNLLRGRVNRMEALIEGLLQYSRVGRVKTSLEIVNVYKLLADVIDSLAPPSTFNVKVGPGMPMLYTDRLLLGQVFSNLLGNAIKHNTRQAGSVQISVQDLGDFYEFSVTDDGPGIAPQYHEKVFAIFSTLEARDKVENTGIGLSLVKKIVETQGGTIHLDSDEGLGATFRFTWPKNFVP